MRTAIAVIAFCLLALPVSAQTGNHTKGTGDARKELVKLVNQLVSARTDNTEELLQQLDRTCVDAMVQSNIEALDLIEADDFTFVSPNGQVMTKAEDLQTLKSGDMVYESVTLDDVSVKTFGDAGVVSGRANVKGRYRTFDISGSYRYTVVFAKRKGMWRAVTSQMTRIPPA